MAEASTNIAEVAESREAIQKPLQRKPLPESARSSVELSSFDLNRQDSAVPEPLSVSTVDRKIVRKPLSPTSPTAPQSFRDEPRTQAQKRPGGPRPLFSESIIGRKPLPGAETGLLSPQTQARGTASNSGRRGASPSSASSAAKQAFSITVIRRDVSSGAQWNVGTVVGEKHDQNLQPANSKKGHFDISVHLTAPGYTKFRSSPDHAHPGGSVAVHPNADSATQHLRDENSPMAEPGFDRKIRMEGASFWDRSKQHRRAHSDFPNMNTRNGARGRGGSIGSPESPISPDDHSKSHESGAKGYAFTSPWGGSCKFLTSPSGRALQCKHTLPGPVSASHTLDSTSSSQVAVAVSELRFNLFASAKFPSPTSPVFKFRDTEARRFQIPNFSHIRDKLSPEKVSRPLPPPRPDASSYAARYPSDDEAPPLPPRINTHSYTEGGDEDTEEPPALPDRLHPFPYSSKSASEEEDGRLDLALGQEKAGGGNKGTQVKLGKLIVMDEGTKMLDLIVAANMGVWWSVWEAT